MGRGLSREVKVELGDQNAGIIPRSPFENIGTKSCGDCTQCCKTMGIEELAKPAGKWCSHARKGSPCGGCAIYEDRPVSCRAFECIWLQSQDRVPAMPIKMRPDRSKVVLITDNSGGRLIAMLAPDHPTAYAKEPMWTNLKQWANSLQVYVVLGDKARRLYPDGHMQDAPNAQINTSPVTAETLNVIEPIHPGGDAPSEPRFTGGEPDSGGDAGAR